MYNDKNLKEVDTEHIKYYYNSKGDIFKFLNKDTNNETIINLQYNDIGELIMVSFPFFNEEEIFEHIYYKDYLNFYLHDKIYTDIISAYEKMLIDYIGINFNISTYEVCKDMIFNYDKDGKMLNCKIGYGEYKFIYVNSDKEISLIIKYTNKLYSDIINIIDSEIDKNKYIKKKKLFKLDEVIGFFKAVYVR